MGKFTIGDKFTHVRKSAGTKRIIETMGTGIIKSECMVIEGIDHYTVEWDIKDGIVWANTHHDIICDKDSLKYGYRHLNNK